MPSKMQNSPAKQQPVISSFFARMKDNSLAETSLGSSKGRLKRSSSPIDLTGDSPGRPPAKKLKLEDAEPPAPLTLSRSLKATGFSSKLSVEPKAKLSGKSVVQKWRFIPTASQNAASPLVSQPQANEVPPSRDEVRAKEARREAFKKKLLGRTNTFSQEKENEDPFLEASPEEKEEDEHEDDSLEGTFQELRNKFSARKSNSRESVPTVKAKGKGKKVEEVGPSGLSYTPLEKQIMRLKDTYPDTLLLVEVGYKYRFFGEDARTASKELGIACFPSRNFLSASIPVHRRGVHVKKLVSQGYKVGIVGQTETAALKKVGTNRNAPFDRKLLHLYTPATYVDELDTVADDEFFGQTTSRPMMCVIEEPRGGMGADERVLVGMVSVVASTGDIVYDEFEDGHMRTELETRMTHIRPCELLLPSKGLSKPTEKMLGHFAGDGASSSGDRVRVERISSTMDYTSAFEYVSEFYKGHSSEEEAEEETREEEPSASENFRSGKLMATVPDFPHNVIIALAHLIKHLATFSLADAFTKTNFFSQFTTKAHMLLAGNTLNNLEIFRNQTDFTEKGSLLWILDHTKTKFGSRMLRSWIGRPLVDLRLLQERIDAIEELLEGRSATIDRLRMTLRGLPDLVKGLCRVQYGKCSPKELASLLTAFERLSNLYSPFDTPTNVGFRSPVLNDILFSLPTLLEPMNRLLASIDLQQARLENKQELWLDPEKYPEINETNLCIMQVESELKDHLLEIRKTIKSPAQQYVTVSGIEYLIEVKGDAKKRVPPDWTRISSTKSVTRFHTPTVKEKLQQREVYKETLVAEAEKAYRMFLEEIADEYDLFRDVTNKLAIADCLLSLATVANQQGYCRPTFIEDDKVEIINGRHPMVEALTSDPFVPNSLLMGGGAPRNRIITGPNMGGKSSCVRMAALIIIMAQIGSYVPADSAKLGLQDAVLTRMGASDELLRGRSTFMVELSETSDILKTASSRSLVILDELGRGTSTFDGMAIASAVLTHLVKEIKAKTLFITHYPLLATELEKKFPDDLSNNHMGFIEQQRSDHSTDISFLYKLAPGMAKGSYGIECARLAGLPVAILQSAQARSMHMKTLVEGRTDCNKLRRQVELLRKCVLGAEMSEQEWSVLRPDSAGPAV